MQGELANMFTFKIALDVTIALAPTKTLSVIG